VLLLTLAACNSTPKQANQSDRAPTPPAVGDQAVPSAGDPGAATAKSPRPSAPPAAGCEKSANGTTYEVGEGQKYTRIVDVPWQKLGAGDTVRIHWRKEPYREKFLISSQGKESAPIRICGVPGPSGERPVIDGENAISRKGDVFPYVPTQDRGIVILSLDKVDRYGFKPQYIVIEGLEIRNAGLPHSYTDVEGKTRAYFRNAAAIFVERGEHITIRNCALHDSGTGLFMASGRDEQTMSRDLLVEGNRLWGNGVTGSDRQHSVYTEVSGVVFQYNYFGPPREGAMGNNIKDRSAGTVVRYNTIEGGAHLLDLVEAEESSPLMIKEPNFNDAWVYGNVMLQGDKGASNMIHFGGDTGLTNVYRNGTLYFYNNTVVIRANQEQRWRISLFRLENANQSVDARNNIFYRVGTTHLALMHLAGKLHLGVNWISKGWQKGKEGFAEPIEGIDNLIVGDDPGFEKDGYGLRADSPCIDAAQPLPASIPASLQVTRSLDGSERRVVGKALDLGALERQ